MSVNVSEDRLTVPARPVRRVIVEAVRFGAVGGSGVLVNFLFYNLLLHGFGWRAMTATVLASLVAMGTNCLGFRYFRYRNRDSRTRQQIALFFVFSAIGVAMERGLFYVGCHGLGLHGPVGSNAVKGVSIVLASAFRFLVCRTWVFRH
ncbi:GtrA family protein [Streptomyces sp. ADMS]|uniref:GtrA family protein n=1 Tax=Streptomyces sp. ADMS TaxID=3071415 RepID=UPI00296F8AAA|nr:GtrA family protein [Streptomyces sp. ADMS]MDW4910423.1 GtrA family protein [Streptomyces sp. ADMS]